MKFQVFATLMLAATHRACDLDLDFRCNDGNYAIINPDASVYTGISVFDENGTCEVSKETGNKTLMVRDCGLVSIYALHADFEF